MTARTNAKTKGVPTRDSEKPSRHAQAKATARKTNGDVGYTDVAAQPFELVKPVLMPRQALFINALPDNIADDLMVSSMAEQMYGKMGYNRMEGKAGWHTTQCSTEDLKLMLKNLVAKQDWIDVAIVSSMLLIREQLAM
jgi:hypothetical protein